MFEHIQPYSQNEIPEAISRIASNPLLDTIVQYLFPTVHTATFKQSLLSIKSTKEFQEKVMLKAIRSIIQQTSTGLTFQGFEHLQTSQRYLFISNHRDILLDAAILQVLLHQHQHDTSEITFGNNLMQSQLAIDIGKSNKMFRIERGGTPRDFYQNLLEISQYIRHTLLLKKQSIWIAQRNGRTKNGSDKTDAALIKMLTNSSNKPFDENIAELNITPISISYEYEPCDFLKTQELYISQYQNYTKKKDEDLQSIIQGITQPKGHIHLTITQPLRLNELSVLTPIHPKKQSIQLASIIDQRINSAYKLWSNNYIAYDLLTESKTFDDRYTPEEKENFLQYLHSGLLKLNGNSAKLKEIFLGIYANPIHNSKPQKK